MNDQALYDLGKIFGNMESEELDFCNAVIVQELKERKEKNGDEQGSD